MCFLYVGNSGRLIPQEVGVLPLPLYLIAFLFELFEDKNYIFSVFVFSEASIMQNGYYIAGAALVQLFLMEELQNTLTYN